MLKRRSINIDLLLLVSEASQENFEKIIVFFKPQNMSK